jgi:translocation and assembly module TamB
MRTVNGLEPRLSSPSAYLICGSAMGGRISIDLAVGRTRQYPLRGRIALDRVELPGLSAIPGAPPSRAILSGELVFEDGGVLEPHTLVAHATFTQLEFGRGDLRFTNRGPILVAIRDGVISVDRARFRGPDSRIRVRGQYTLPSADREGGLALAVRGDVDLGVLSRLTPVVLEASGRARVHLALSGPLTDPEVYGDAELRGGRLRIAGLPSAIEGLDARVTLSARSVLLEDLRAQVAGGTVRGRGQARLADGALERYNLQISAEQLSFAPIEGLDLTLGADVELAWSRGARLPLLTGEVRVERLVHSRHIDLGYTLGELSRPQRAEVVRYDPSADRLAFDLRIVGEAPFAIRNNFVEAELVVDDSRRPFRLVGTDQRFGLLGNLRFVRGQLFFRNTVFDIQAGALSFDDDTRVDPRFEVRALTELVRRSGDLSAPRWRIFLEAQGTPDAFEITTRSDPDLPQEDVLMLLALGMTRGELGQLQGSDLGSTAALEALSALTGVDREVRRVVPLIDDFRVTTAYSVRTGRTEPRISVGKRSADRVRISASTGIGTGTTRDVRAALEVELTEETGIQCSYDNFGSSSTSFGNAGCDLRWRLDLQ